jgi:hypothetical protein
MLIVTARPTVTTPVIHEMTAFCVVTPLESFAVRQPSSFPPDALTNITSTFASLLSEGCVKFLRMRLKKCRTYQRETPVVNRNLVDVRLIELLNTLNWMRENDRG